MTQTTLIALAGALTGLVGIPAALLIFFVDRALKQRASRDDVQIGTAAAILIVAIYASAIDGAAWWAWNRAFPTKSTLALDLDSRLFFAILFAPPALFGVMAAAWALVRLLMRLYRAATTSSA